MWHPWPAGALSLAVETLNTLMILRVMAYLVKHSTSPAGRDIESAVLALALLSGAWFWIVMLGTALGLGHALEQSRNEPIDDNRRG